MPKQESYLKRYDSLPDQLAYSVIPTGIRGAYAIPGWPVTVDPRTASATELARHGLLLRRPDKSAGKLNAVWDRAFARPWRPEDRVLPEMESQIGVTHLPRDVRRRASGTFTSTNWAGSVLPGTWVGCVGVWKIPTVTQPTEKQGNEGGWNSSSWAGVDGYGSNDVLQAGIQQKVTASGEATYLAWYEWYAPPQLGSPSYIYQTNIDSFSVSPGDEIYCTVQYNAGRTSSSIYMYNYATEKPFAITLAAPPGASASGNCAEWIMEAPDNGYPTSALPAFSNVEFTSASACPPNWGTPGANVTWGKATDGDTWNVAYGGTTLTEVSFDTIGINEVTIKFLG